MKKYDERRLTTSKLILWVTGFIFYATVFYLLVLLYFMIFSDKASCYTDIAAIVSVAAVTGGAYSIALASYSNKARYENCIKLGKEVASFKYKTLSELGCLDRSKAQNEIEREFDKLDGLSENEERLSCEEISSDNKLGG